MEDKHNMEYFEGDINPLVFHHSYNADTVVDCNSSVFYHYCSKCQQDHNLCIKYVTDSSSTTKCNSFIVSVAQPAMASAIWNAFRLDRSPLVAAGSTSKGGAHITKPISRQTK
jgi:hypothetical protein